MNPTEHAPPEAEPAPREVDYAPMVRAALWATGLAVLVKVGSSLWLAHRRGVPVEVRFFADLVPYLAFLVGRSPFLVLAATSTLIMAVVSVACLCGSLLRARRNQFIAGWLAGPLAVANTLLVDLVRHLLDRPYLLWRIGRWSVLCVAISAVLTAAWLAINRPWRPAGESGEHLASESGEVHPSGG
ncbi:MAG: hypothetical protein ACRC0L_07985 [Angustibacter sp.]